MTFCVNGEHLSLENAAELLAMTIAGYIGGAWQSFLEAMRDLLRAIRPGCRKEYKGLSIARDYYKG